MPDCPTRMSISAAMSLSPSCSHPPCYLQDLDEIADDVIITKPRNRCVKVTTVSVISLQCHLGIKPRATVASIQVLFRGIKAQFTLVLPSLTPILSAFCTIMSVVSPPMQGNLPTFRLNATVRGAFMPDSTLEFLPIFSSLKCTKSSKFSDFLHSLQWFDPRKLPRYFQA